MYGAVRTNVCKFMPFGCEVQYWPSPASRHQRCRHSRRSLSFGSPNSERCRWAVSEPCQRRVRSEWKVSRVLAPNIAPIKVFIQQKWLYIKEQQIPAVGVRCERNLIFVDYFRPRASAAHWRGSQHRQAGYRNSTVCSRMWNRILLSVVSGGPYCASASSTQAQVRWFTVPACRSKLDVRRDVCIYLGCYSIRQVVCKILIPFRCPRTSSLRHCSCCWNAARAGVAHSAECLSWSVCLVTLRRSPVSVTIDWCMGAFGRKHT